MISRNLVIEYRMADYREDVLPRLAAELVELKVAIIVALAPPAIMAAKAATTTIPIVMRTTIDPIKAEFVASMARPGGNVTGPSSVSGSLYGKRLDLLKELVPGLTHIGMIWNPRSPTAADYSNNLAAAAKALGLVVSAFPVRSADAFAAAFAAAARMDAIIPLRDPLVVSSRALIVDLAIRNRIPAMYDDRQFTQIGGLVSYGTNLAALHRRAAYYVDRILAGAKPADLPVEEPTKFELVINLKTAKALGLDVPPKLLALADEVIE
jgi:putative ABC transport system substrate-binding protein